MNEKKFPLYPALILFALAIVVIILRLHSLGEPLERDITGYSYIANELLSGKLLYTDLWDHHPPGIYWVYMTTGLVLGYNPVAVFVLGAVFTIISLIFIYLLILSLSDKRAALFGAFFWALASTSIYLEANQPNTELFMNTFTMIALWGFVRFGPDSRRGLAFTGLFFAIASVFKTVVFFPFLAVVVYVLIEELRKGGKSRKAVSIDRILLLSGPGFIVWTLVFFYFIVVGRLADFWNAVFAFNLHYSGGMLTNLWNYISTPSLLFHPSQIELVPLIILSAGYLLAGSSRPRPIKRWFFIALLIATALEVASPGRFFPHYYQLYIPVLSIMSALFIFEVGKKIPDRKKALAAILILFLMPALYLSYFQVKYLGMDPFEISEVKYSDVFTSSYRLGKYLEEKTAPCETLYEYGQETGIYYYSQRRTPAGNIFLLMLFVGDSEFKYAQQKKLYNEVTGAPPAYFIWNLAWGDVRKNIFYNFLNENYNFKGRKFEYYLVYEYKHRKLDPSGKPICQAADNNG